MAAMARIFVEGWDPDYGSPIDRDDTLTPAEGSVDPTVEAQDWQPIEGHDDGVEQVAFVDGVRRVDARLTLDDPVAGPTSGMVGTFAVGATRWDRPARRSQVTDVRVERWAVLAGGREEQMPTTALDPAVGTTTCASEDPGYLLIELHTRMRRAEGELATKLARDEWFVVADGPLNDLSAHSVVGLVKSHRVTYLEPARNAVVAHLAPGQRTPLFCIADYKRYSWYVRLAMLRASHSWTGIVRCETSGQLPTRSAITLADRTAAVLPVVASEPHVDPRAPQNLVPIGALEKELRHRMGDRGLVYRALREAVMQEPMLA
jgi:hypothetical protein